MPWGDERPRTRGECLGRPRPCPWVGCRHHLLLDVTEAGTIRLNPSKGLLSRDAYSCAVRSFVERSVAELEDAEHTCALDLAEDGADRTLKAVGELFSLTRQGVELIEKRALAKLREDVEPEDFEDAREDRSPVLP